MGDVVKFPIQLQVRVEMKRVSNAEMDAWIEEYGVGVVAYPWAVSEDGRVWPTPRPDVVVFKDGDEPYFVIWQ